jgi:hypothetical protein
MEDIKVRDTWLLHCAHKVTCMLQCRPRTTYSVPLHLHKQADNRMGPTLFRLKDSFHGYVNMFKHRS